MPLVGTVAAGGKTPGELAQAISAQLQDRYLKKPQVSVNVKKAKGQTFTVDGAVKQSGVFPIVGRMTLQQAVATAKGASDSADVGNVVVFRTVNNQRVYGVFDLTQIRNGKQIDPPIYPNDTIVVASSGARRTLRDIVGVVPLLPLLLIP